MDMGDVQHTRRTGEDGVFWYSAVVVCLCNSMVQLRWKFEQKNGYSTVTKVIALILISLLIAKEYYVRFII